MSTTVTRKIYAESHDDPGHRVLMYSVDNDADWWLLKETIGLRKLDDDEHYIDRRGGYWYVKRYEETT